MPDNAPFRGETPIFGAAPRVPPSNLMAEQALLGSLLSNNAKTADLCQFLRAEHFADPIHAYIFQRAMDRIAAGQLADAVTLKSDFENTGVLDDVGGTNYLAQLLNANIGWMTTGTYAKTIYDTWMRRQLINVSEDIANAAFGEEPGADVTKMVDNAAEAVLALGGNAAANRGTDFATAAERAVQRALAAWKGSPGERRLDTGIGPVDAVWNGLWPGQLYYVMARSRTGKTPFMMQIARNVARTLRDEAATTGKPSGHVHVFSLEMTAEDLLTINLASVTDLSADQIRGGQIGPAFRHDDEAIQMASGAAWKQFAVDAKELGSLPIEIDDASEMDLPALVMRARAVKRQKHTRLICIDYRELVRRGREQSRMQLPEWVPYLGYQLKALAKATNCPVIALAQINKTKSGDMPVRPTLDDLPYDGGQAADGVFALHRPELYMPMEQPRLPSGQSKEKLADAQSAWEQERAKVRDVAEFIALKRRFGPTGTPVKLRFNGPRMLLTEWREDAAARQMSLMTAPPVGRWDDVEEGEF